MIPHIPHSASLTRTPLVLAAVAAVALAGAGCAGRGSPGHQPGPPVTAPSGSSAPSGSPGSPGPSGVPGSPGSPTPPGSASATPPPDTGGVLTLDGVARHGVEPGCTVFDAGSHGLYLLLGAGGGTPDQKSIPLGVPLRVRGVLVDQFVSYCQQGRPMEIVDIVNR